MPHALPVWFLFALAGSVCSALGNHMHQRLGGSSAASAVWLKIFAVAVAIPVLLTTGLPHNPKFYLLTAGAAAIWCVNDLIFFGAIARHGAALIARLAPLGIIISFFAWFALHPALFHRYYADTPRFAALCFVLVVTSGCAVAVRKCPFSWQALKSIWFVIAGGVIGTFLLKSAVDFAPARQGVFGYVGFEAAMMLCFYAVIFTMFRRAEGRDILTWRGFKTGGIVAIFLVVSVILRTYAQKKVDHPAFPVMVSMLDVVWLMALNRLSGWKDDSNKLAGLGIAAAAIMLAFLKLP